MNKEKIRIIGLIVVLILSLTLNFVAVLFWLNQGLKIRSLESENKDHELKRNVIEK
ncbi:MAG: hypothetical protein H7343_22615 [Undibacterium sp.]|nr:hypothetical protein [Opitutaceae bacterium]